MAGLLIGLAGTILGVVCHAVVLRRLPVRFALISVPAFLLAALAAATVVYWNEIGSVHADEIIAAFILSMSVGLCYALTLFGVLYDSPTLALVNAIVGFGATGMPKAAFFDFVRDHPFMSSRLAALEATNRTMVEADDFVLPRSNLTPLLWLGESYRRLRGTPAAH